MHNILVGAVEDVNGGREVNTFCSGPVNEETKSCTELVQELGWSAERRPAMVSVTATRASFVVITLSTGAKTKGPRVVGVTGEAVWISVGSVSLPCTCPGPPKAPVAW